MLLSCSGSIVVKRFIVQVTTEWEYTFVFFVFFFIVLPTWRKTRPVLTDWESRDLISRGSRVPTDSRCRSGPYGDVFG